METIRCRVKRYGWLVVPPLVLAGICLLMLPFIVAWGNYFLSGLMAAPIFGLVLWIVKILVFDEIVADETGLRWRSVFKPQKSTRWDEISDFYLEEWTEEPIIETPQGKLKIGADFNNKNRMMAVIAERAMNAPARQWEKAEYRAAKPFTKRFDYWTKSQKWMAPIQFLGSVCIFVYFGWTVCFGQQPNSSRYQLSRPTDWLSFFTAVTTVAPIILVFAMSFPNLCDLWRARKFARKHRDEHLEISSRGLAWQRGEKRIDANWDEIRAIRYVAGDRQNAHFWVETRNGDFAVWRSLESIALWVQLVNQFAPQLAPKIPTDDPDLGAESATWSGGEVGVGARIFHFRTRNTRLILWGATAFALSLPLIPLCYRLMQTPDDAPSAIPVKAILVALFLLVAALIYAWLCFARAAIWADETGLEWRVPLWKTRRVAWRDIESSGPDETENWIQTRAGKRKLWLISAPVRKAELLQLIAQRAQNGAAVEAAQTDN